MAENNIAELNKRFPSDRSIKLSATQKAELKKILESLKGKYAMKLLDDDYLFSIAASKANFKTMQLVNDYRELVFKQKNTKNNAGHTSDLQQQKLVIRRTLLETLFGSYKLINEIDQKTIAINQELLHQLMA